MQADSQQPTDPHQPAGIGQCRWIALDAVGTLIYPDPPAEEVYFEIARRHGSRLMLQDVAGRFSKAFRDSRSRDPQPGGNDDTDPWATSELRERERWRWIVSRVINDVADVDHCFLELFDHFAEPAAWKCFDDVEESLSLLQSAGLRLAIASNFDARLNRLCDELSPLRPIERRVISASVGYRKPGAAFFQALIDATEDRPQQILMVGDDYENDIVGARQAGLEAVLIDRAGTHTHGGISGLGELVNWLTG